MRKQYQHRVEGSSGPMNVIIQDMLEDSKTKYYKRYYNISGYTDSLSSMLSSSIVSGAKMFNVTITAPSDEDELPIETLMALVAVRLQSDSKRNQLGEKVH